MDFRVSVPAIALAFLAGCGGDDGETPSDASQNSDAQTATVMEVTCVGGEQPIMTMNQVNAYMPASLTISVGQAVQFINSSNHNVTPAATMSDPGLSVGFGGMKCLKFTKAGTFRFKCAVAGHNFSGMVTVN